MRVIFVRSFFIILSIMVGFQIGIGLGIFGNLSGLLGALFGFLGSSFIVFLEWGMRRVSVRGLSAAVFGLVFGLIIANLLNDVLSLIPLEKTIASYLKLITIIIFCYLGMVIAMRGRDEFNLIIPYVKFTRQDQKQDIVILDTSVIIDGRISDIFQTRFVDARIVIPRFVLKELQFIADSSDSLKRNRGRRGLDILHKIQKASNVDVKIHEEDFPDLADTDAKLVRLAKMLGGKLFTNDYNLNKGAELQGVPVLNLNELANALKPVVLPGETMEVRIVKEGKEYNQGVAYLDDGTMIVVDNARQMMGQTRTVLVTSVLQTSAGRMIFAKIEEGGRR